MDDDVGAVEAGGRAGAMTGVAELRARSAFSFGTGSAAPEALAERAAELGYAALGLTDAADLGGTIRFALAAERCGLHAVAGAELVVDGRPAAFLARDERGWRSLATLVTRARVGGWDGWSRERIGEMRGRPRLRWADVEAHAEGLHALTGPADGEVASLLRAGRPDEAARALRRWQGLFGGRLAVEVGLHGAGGADAALAGALVELAEREGVPWAACASPCHLGGDGRLVHDLLVALRHGTTVDDAERRGLLLPSGGWALADPAALRRLWRGREQGLEEAARIAAGCAFDVAWARPPLPRFTRDGRDDEMLADCVKDGMRERWGEPTRKQRRQIEHELRVIAKLGAAGFFLVMGEIVRECRRRGILAQGRGSAANSAVAYCLGITAVDPVREGLLFERFLSEARLEGGNEAPDIDLDIEHDRREEILDWMYARWNRPGAAICCTVQEFRAPSALQDAMRALGYPAALALRLSRRLHRHGPASGAAELEGGLAERFGLALDDARGRALLAALRAMEGLPRMRSTHVGGFVLSSEPLGGRIPVEPTTMGRTILQFDKDDLDAVGVPKFDLLGLGGLSLVRRAFDAVEARTGMRPEMYRIRLDHRPTYEMISRGETIGAFQIESRAQIASLLQTRPERIYDLVVQVALIRPGPIQGGFVHPYVQRRRGLEPPDYPHPLLEPVLERTYGIPIFQEQAMRISMLLGGFSAAEADALRRAMGHQRKAARLREVLAALRGRMVEKGLDEEMAERIVAELQGFSNYGFPESHAWSFALIAYVTCWLRCVHPSEFYLALLNSWPMGFYAPSTVVNDARRVGVEVRPPCLARGDWECTLEPSDDASRPALRVGLRFVRGLGGAARERLRAAREEGPFRSVEDAVARAGMGRAEALHLARAGAFEAWEPGRRRAAWEALRAAGGALPLAPARALSLEVAEMEDDELVFLDYLATGISVTGHPMEAIRARLDRAGATHVAALREMRDGDPVTVAGLVVSRQRPQTAKGTLFLLLEDEHGLMNVVVHRTRVAANREVVEHAAFVIVEGRVGREGDVISVVGRRFRELRARRLAFRSRDFR